MSVGGNKGKNTLPGFSNKISQLPVQIFGGNFNLLIWAEEKRSDIGLYFRRKLESLDFG